MAAVQDISGITYPLCSCTESVINLLYEHWIVSIPGPGSILVSSTDPKRIQNPYSFFSDFGGDGAFTLFTISSSGGTVQVWTWSKFKPLQVIWESIPKTVPEGNQSFWLVWMRNPGPSSWSCAPAQLRLVGQASINKNCFLICGSLCWPQPAPFRKDAAALAMLSWLKHQKDFCFFPCPNEFYLFCLNILQTQNHVLAQSLIIHCSLSTSNISEQICMFQTESYAKHCTVQDPNWLVQVPWMQWTCSDQIQIPHFWSQG